MDGIDYTERSPLQGGKIQSSDRIEPTRSLDAQYRQHGPFSAAQKSYGPVNSVETGHLDNSDENNISCIETHVYKRRWYILAVFGVFSFTASLVWSTWGPISNSSKCAYGWTDGMIATLLNWGSFIAIPGAFVSVWILDAKGLRISCVLSYLCCLVGAGLRCIPANKYIFTWLVNAGQIMNAFGGPIAVGAIPRISSLWFPPHQRTTSTALMIIMNSLGLGASFLIGPYMVASPPTINSTNSDLNCTDDITTQHDDIKILMYVECAFAAVGFLAMLVYFPEKPPLPPSLSADIKRANLKDGIKKIMRNSGFWSICVAYGVGLGIYNSWQGIISVALEPFDISQNEAGWIGFYSIIGSCSGSITLAYLADKFERRTIQLIFILFLLSTGIFCVFSLVCQGVIPQSKVILYVTILSGGFALNGATPLMFEIAAEFAYPVSEGVSTITLFTANNIVAVIFLLILLIPNIGQSWMNWTVVAGIAVSVPIVMATRSSYNRLDVDEQTDVIAE